MVLLLTLALVGCGTVKDFFGSAPPSNGKGAAGREKQSSTRSRDQSIEEIIVLMQNGRAKRAHVALLGYLKRYPGHPVARDLLRQMDVDPKVYLGKKFHFYTVKGGDSLAHIAGRFLGDELKFYALARYNGISDPGLLEVGQKLKIPSPRDQRKTSRSDVAATTHVSARLKEARAAMMVSDYEQVIALLRDSKARNKAETALLGRAYKRLVQAHLQLNRLSAAGEVVSEAEQIQPVENPWNAWLLPLAAEVRGRIWQQRGMKALQGKDREQALNAFANAVSFQADLQPAAEQYARLKRDLVKEYHEAALLLYRNQKLDQAIKLWDRVLAIDPEFSHARTYRARAVELKKRLFALDGSGQNGDGG